MKFSREEYSLELLAEMLPLWKEHHAETANALYGPLDPDIELYEQVAESGKLRIFTARRWNGMSIELCGYQVFMVASDIHSRRRTQAIQDILFMTEDARKGMTGYLFIKWCLEQLESEGVDVVHQRISARNDFGKVLERLGYALEDLTYSKGRI